MSTIDRMLKALHESANAPDNSKLSPGAKLNFKYLASLTAEGKLTDNIESSKVTPVTLATAIGKLSNSDFGKNPFAKEVILPIISKLRAEKEVNYYSNIDNNQLYLDLTFKLGNKGVESNPSAMITNISKLLGKSISNLSYDDVYEFMLNEVQSSLKANLPKVKVHVGVNQSNVSTATIIDSDVLGDQVNVKDKDLTYVGDIKFKLDSIEFENHSRNKNNQRVFNSYIRTGEYSK